MKFDSKALREKLEEIGRYVEKLKEAKEDKDKIDRILGEIEELDEILQHDEEDELKAFRLLRMLIEKLKDLGGKVPLLDTFLELYIAALKSTEYFIDNVLKKYSFTGRICDLYCDVRKREEEKLIDEGEDKDEAALKGHKRAMSAIGEGEYARYEEELKKQYENRRLKKWIQDEIKTAKEDKDEQGDKEDGNEVGDDSEFKASIKTIDSLLALLQLIKQLEDRLREPDFDPDERKRLEKRLDALWKVFQAVVSPK